MVTATVSPSVPPPTSGRALSLNAAARTAPIDLVNYLHDHGIQTYRGSGQEVTAHCWFCLDGNTKGKGKLYLNTESWLYDCKRCGETGNQRTLLRYFGDEELIPSFLPGTDPALRREILSRLVELAHTLLQASDSQVMYLLDRGLSPETIDRARFGYVPEGTPVSVQIGTYTQADLLAAGIITPHGKEVFSNCITIPYYSHGQVVQVRSKPLGEGGYRTPGGDQVRLYNADALQSASDVVICEGEFDTRALEQELQRSGDPRLRMTAAVGIPGAGAWPAEFHMYFESMRRVFIGLDPDQPGRDAAVKMKALLGTKSRVLELPAELPKCDWNEYLRPATDSQGGHHAHGGHTWRDVQALLMRADLSGKRMFSVGEAQRKWGHRNAYNPGIRLGFPSLDAFMSVKPGQVCIPLANTGTGKSAFLSNVTHNARRHRVLSISLELTAEEVYEHLHKIHHFWHPTATAAQTEADFANVRIADPNRLRAGDLEALIDEFTEDVGEAPELVLLDYLQYYARGFAGGGVYEKVSDAVMEIKAVAKGRRCGFIVPSQVNRGAKAGEAVTLDDARDSGVIEETGDQVLGLVRPDMRPNEHGVLQPATGAYSLAILKARGPGVGRVMHGQFSSMSLALVDQMDRKHTAMVMQENQHYARGMSYEEFRRVSLPALTLVGGA